MKKGNSDIFYLERNISSVVAASSPCWRKFLKDERGKPNHYFVTTAKLLEIQILTSLMVDYCTYYFLFYHSFLQAGNL